MSTMTRDASETSVTFSLAELAKFEAERVREEDARRARHARRARPEAHARGGGAAARSRGGARRCRGRGRRPPRARRGRGEGPRRRPAGAPRSRWRASPPRRRPASSSTTRRARTSWPSSAPAPRAGAAACSARSPPRSRWCSPAPAWPATRCRATWRPWSRTPPRSARGSRRWRGSASTPRRPSSRRSIGATPCCWRVPAPATRRRPCATADSARHAVDPSALENDRLRTFGDALDALEARLVTLEKIAALDRRSDDLAAWAAASRRSEIIAPARTAAVRAKAMGNEEAVRAYASTLEQIRAALAAPGSTADRHGGAAAAANTTRVRCDPHVGDPGCGLDGFRMF